MMGVAQLSPVKVDMWMERVVRMTGPGMQVSFSAALVVRMRNCLNRGSGKA